MCGIAGYYRLPVAPDKRRGLLARMIGSIAHRGPDGNGILRRRRRRPGARAPEHHRPRRRPAADVQRGRHRLDHLQRRDLQLRRAARRAASPAATRFRTSSDTEVIVHLYEERGPDCVEQFNGDFAFAIWDARKQRLVLARDRMGVRPLYYTVRDGGLAFASEVKALLEVPGISAAARSRSPSTRCSRSGSRSRRARRSRTSPSCRRRTCWSPTREGISTRPYWRFDYPGRGRGPAGVGRRTKRAIAEELRALLLDADAHPPARRRAGRRLPQRRPRFLDHHRRRSSSFTARPAAHLLGRPSRTPSSTRARSSRRWSRARHRALDRSLCRDGDIGALFPERHPAHRAADPAHGAGAAAAAVAAGARQRLQGGADRRGRRRGVRRLRHLQGGEGPPLLRRASRTRRGARCCCSGSIPTCRACRASRSATSRRSSRAGRQRARRPAVLAPAALPHDAPAPRRSSPRDLRAALGGYDALADLRERLPADFARWHPLSQAQYLETAHLLPGYILSSQGDRVGMAHAVEGRFPFLDHRVVEFAARIPPRLKLKGLREKHILRAERCADLLPRQHRHAAQAAVPRAREPARSCARARPPPCSISCRRPTIDAAGLLRCARPSTGWCRSARRLPSTGFRDNMAFVGILSTQLWHETFVNGAPATVA